MNNKVLKGFIIGVLLLFVIHQIYSFFYNPFVTESTKYYEAVDGMSLQGLVIREESVISGSDGVLHFIAEDGNRVAKDGTIAEIYESTSSSVAVNRINELSKEINSIKSLTAYNSVSASDLSVANLKVDNALGALITSCSSGNFYQSKELSSNLVLAINHRQVITGEQTDFTARLSSLEAELAALQASLPAAYGYIKAPMSGYYLSHIDGYESVLSGKSAEDITAEFLDSVTKNQIPEGAIGKIVSGYEWYVAAKISVNDANKYTVGEELEMHTSLGGGEDLPVTVKSINMSETQNDAVIVLSCGSMSREIASVRYSNFTIINRTYKGLKVAREALRIQNGKSGVYVLNGAKIKFVPVEVIYNVDDYVICKKETSNDNVLRLYDDVVVKGKKLYDGKVVG